MCSSPHWQVGSSWFREKLSPGNRNKGYHGEQISQKIVSRELNARSYRDFAKNIALLGATSTKFVKSVGKKMGSNMRPWYIQFRDIRDRDISGLQCTLFPGRYNLNDLCDLDFWPIDLEMVHNTSSPHGFYLCHMWIQSMKITWFIAGIFLVECVGSVYAPSTYLSYLWVEIKELNLKLLFFSGPLCSLTCAVALCHVTPPVVLWALSTSVGTDGWSLHWSYALYEKDTCYDAGNHL